VIALRRRADGVATLTLRRPKKLNALTFAGYRDLRDTFRELAHAGDVRAVVLAGAGPGFCSGGDRDEIVRALAAMSGPDLLAFTRLTGDVVLAMRRLRKPIVAAVGGAAVGAGAVLALAADLRVASTRARFGFVFPRLGLAGADMGAAWLLPRIVGLGRATELLLLGDLVDAAAAERLGLVHRVVAPEVLDGAAHELAARLAAGPAFATGMTKEMLNREAHMDLDTALEAEAQAQQICLQTPEFRAAARRPRGPRPRKRS
jgi:enoyl-CoA hydratase/carnithine racemase